MFYTYLLQAIQRGLEGEEGVEEIMANFEAAIWKAAKEVFPVISMKTERLFLSLGPGHNQESIASCLLHYCLWNHNHISLSYYQIH